MAAARNNTLQTVAMLITTALALVAGFLVYGATGHDDAHINFWSAWTLLQHGELLNYNFERVEQTTNILQDLLTAALHLLSGINLVTAGFLVDILAALACCYLLWRQAQQLCPSLSLWGVPLLLSSSSFLLWSYGGMGATLAALCLTATATVWSRWLHSAQPAAALCLQLATVTIMLTLERPEMPLVAIALAAWLLVWHWQQPLARRRGLQLLAVSLCAAIALFGWQQWYFGSWLPVPVLAKQGGDWLEKCWRGVQYLHVCIVLNPVLLLAALVLPALCWHRRQNSPAHSLLLALAGIFGAYGGFIVTAGGDWMQAGRFVVPIMPAATLLLITALQRLPLPWLAHAMLLLLTTRQFYQQATITVPVFSHGIPAWVQYRLSPAHEHYGLFEKRNQEHLRDLAVIDHLAEIIPPLHKKLARPVTLMSGQAGMVFYYTAQRFGTQVQFRDLRGLVEPSLTLCPATRDVARAQQGLFWGYRDFFERLPQLQTECGISAPDIIYDINDIWQKLGKSLEPLGYTMIHKETGFIVENPTSLPYNRLLSPNMIFLRNDLMPLLGNPPRRNIAYPELPLRQGW